MQKNLRNNSFKNFFTILTLLGALFIPQHLQAQEDEPEGGNPLFLTLLYVEPPRSLQVDPRAVMSAIYKAKQALQKSPQYNPDVMGECTESNAVYQVEKGQEELKVLLILNAKKSIEESAFDPVHKSQMEYRFILKAKVHSKGTYSNFEEAEKTLSKDDFDVIQLRRESTEAPLTPEEEAIDAELSNEMQII